MSVASLIPSRIGTITLIFDLHSSCSPALPPMAFDMMVEQPAPEVMTAAT